MLGVRLPIEAEARLDRHARDVGRPKSAIVRDWIIQRLEREEVDDLIRNAAALHARYHVDRAGRVASDEQLRLLDAEDGGYDWGEEGPPDPR